MLRNHCIEAACVASSRKEGDARERWQVLRACHARDRLWVVDAVVRPCRPLHDVVPAAAFINAVARRLESTIAQTKYALMPSLTHQVPLLLTNGLPVT